MKTDAKHSAHPGWWGHTRVQVCSAVLCMLLLPITLASERAQPASTEPAVALASSFRTLWPALMDAYRMETGAAAPRSSFASSGLLTTQIRHGAPFELFLSADIASVALLHELGKTKDAGTPLATGRISLLAASSADHHLDGLPSLATLLAESDKDQEASSFTIALPNPRHAPYGVAARQALSSYGLWPLPRGTVLAAENAAQALQFALSGAVDYAIVPSILLTQVPPRLQVTDIAADSHEPVVHQMALLSSASVSALALYEWLQGDNALAVLTRFGLEPAR